MSHIGEFISKVIKTLHEHGYPGKRVSLPLDRMYELAAKKGYSFNKVLDFLKEKEGIDNEKTNEKIIFFPVEPGPKQDGDLNGKPDMAAMMRQAAEMMRGMDPEQLGRIQNMLANLSEDERQELLRKAKELGFPGLI